MSDDHQSGSANQHHPKKHDLKGGFPHGLGSSEIPALRGVDSFVCLLASRRSCSNVFPQKFQQHSSQDHHKSDEQTDGPKGTPPTHGNQKLGTKRAQHQAAEAEAHHEHAGNQTLLVWKEPGHRADDHIVADPHAKAAEHAVIDVKMDEFLRGAGQDKSSQQQDASQTQEQGAADLPDRESASYQSADAEHGHRNGKGQRGLASCPAEFLLQGCDKDGPAVDETDTKEHEDAHADHSEFACFHPYSSCFLM